MNDAAGPADDLPNFDHGEIILTSSEIHPNHWRMEAEVPAEQVKRFGRQLRGVKKDIHPQEVATLLVKVLVDEGLDRIGRTSYIHRTLTPETENPTLHPEKPFRGSFDVDGFAEPQWPDFSQIKIREDSIDVTDALVEQEMLDQRLDAGTRTPLEGPLGAGDEIVADVVARIPGREKPAIEASGITLRIPDRDGFLNTGGILLPGGESLHGHRAEENVRFTSSLPTNLFDPELQGQPLEVDIKITSATRVSPATEEFVAAQYGSPNVDILKTQIRFALKQRLADEQQKTIFEQFLPQLQEMVPIELPDFAIEEMAKKKRLPSLLLKLRAKGLDEEATKKTIQKAWPSMKADARRVFGRQILVKMLAQHLKVRTSEEDLLKTIRFEAARLGKRPEELRKELVDSDSIGPYSEKTLELKVASALQSHITQG